jgi:hypothetical protein
MSEEINQNNLFMRKKLTELAAMFKEKRQGNMKLFKKIKARFCLQEGVNPRTADSYCKILESSGLLTISSGEKRWKYNTKEEWDLFSVTPITYRRRGR